MRRVSKNRPGGRSSAAWSKTNSRHRPRERFLMICGLGALIMIGCTLWAWHSGWLGRQADRLVAGTYGLTVLAGFAVQDVLVEGRERTNPGRILAALGVERGSPILALDTRDARRRLESLPWVARASVARHLPDQIYVRLAERRPLALWQIDGEISVIDLSGEVLHGVAPKNFARLPLVVGKGAPQATASLLTMLKGTPALGGLVTAAVRVGERRWNLRLKGGVEVRLPEEQPEQAWARLVDLQRRHDLLARDVATIDMRMPGRLLVRSGSGRELEQGPAKSGQST